MIYDISHLLNHCCPPAAILVALDSAGLSQGIGKQPVNVNIVHDVSSMKASKLLSTDVTRRNLNQEAVLSPHRGGQPPRKPKLR